MDLQALVDYVEVNRTGFRKALKKHDKVLGPLGHPKLTPTYFPKVEASFPEKHRLRVQVCSSVPELHPSITIRVTRYFYASLDSAPQEVQCWQEGKI